MYEQQTGVGLGGSLPSRYTFAFLMQISPHTHTHKRTNNFVVLLSEQRDTDYFEHIDLFKCEVSCILDCLKHTA